MFLRLYKSSSISVKYFSRNLYFRIDDRSLEKIFEVEVDENYFNQSEKLIFIYLLNVTRRSRQSDYDGSTRFSYSTNVRSTQTAW